MIRSIGRSGRDGLEVGKGLEDGWKSESNTSHGTYGTLNGRRMEVKTFPWVEYLDTTEQLDQRGSSTDRQGEPKPAGRSHQSPPSRLDGT